MFSLKRTVLSALIWLPSFAAIAQDDHAYVAAIRLHAGGTAIVGYLHSVSDSAVTILPGRGSKNGLKKALAHPEPISIPVSLIKKVSVMRVRSGGRIFVRAMLISVVYATGFLWLFPIETLGGFIAYTATVTVGTLFTMDLLYTRKYKPTETRFNIQMQQYCLVKSGIMADW